MTDEKRNPAKSTTVEPSAARRKEMATELPDSLKATLTVTIGPDKGTVFTLKQPKTVIGRGDEADFTLAEEGISRAHAAVVFRNFEFRIEDLGSANGTLLNGSDVKDYVLRSGDKITLGGTVLQFSVTTT
jgi:pSer/pThr/pTyr-binding forkhead associated (FHA) protein